MTKKIYSSNLSSDYQDGFNKGYEKAKEEILDEFDNLRLELVKDWVCSETGEYTDERQRLNCIILNKIKSLSLNLGEKTE